MNHETGQWRRPPCALCSRPIEASSDVPPMFLRDSRRWAHWECWKRARVRPEQGRSRDRGWKSVGDILRDMEWPEHGG